MKKIEEDEILKFYRIGKWESPSNFLAQVARKRGFLQSGGIVNMDQAARAVIRDFLNGKLSFHSQPPIVDDDMSDGEDDADMQ